MNKKPPELHLIDGTKPLKRTGRAELLPQEVRQRVPKAEWLDNPDAWDKAKFIEESSEFLFNVYGIGSNQDKHVLSILADQIDVYVNASRKITSDTIVIKYSNGAPGPNPFLSIRNKSVGIIIQLMNELGLTPRGRFVAGKNDADSAVAKLMRGPKG